jgi:hypothetical protein
MQKPSDSTAMMEKRCPPKSRKRRIDPRNRSPAHTNDKTGSRAGKRGAWCSAKPSAIPRLFALIDHRIRIDLLMHMQ